MSKQKSIFGKNTLDFSSLDFSVISEISKKNNSNESLLGLITLSLSIVDKMRYSEDFETLTNLKQ